MFCGEEFNIATAYVFIESFAFQVMQMLNLLLMVNTATTNTTTMVFVKALIYMRVHFTYISAHV